MEFGFRISLSKLSLRDPCLSISPMLLVWGLGEVRVQGVESTWFGRKVALRYLTWGALIITYTILGGSLLYL